MAGQFETLAEEISALSEAQQEEVRTRLALRQEAATIARVIGADEGDVFHVLRNLQLSPTERLRRGLIHGRRRPQLSE